MKMSEVAPPLLMLALSAVLVLGTWHLGYWRDTTPGPAFAPIWLAGAGALLAILQLRSVWAGGASAYDWPDAVGLKRVATAFFGLVAFSVLSPLLMAQPLVPSLITAGVTTGMIYFIFVRWLDVSLPTGYFGI